MTTNSNDSKYPRNDSLKALIDLLIETRKSKNLTQDDINDLIGVADRLVSKWECGMRTPRVFHLYCWAEALGCKLTIVDKDDNSIVKKAANDN